MYIDDIIRRYRWNFVQLRRATSVSFTLHPAPSIGEFHMSARIPIMNSVVSNNHESFTAAFCILKLFLLRRGYLIKLQSFRLLFNTGQACRISLIDRRSFHLRH